MTTDNNRLKKAVAVINYLGRLASEDANGEVVMEGKWPGPDDYPDFYRALTTALAGKTPEQRAAILAGLPPTHFLTVYDNGDAAATLIAYCVARGHEDQADRYVNRRPATVDKNALWIELTNLLYAAGVSRPIATRGLKLIADDVSWIDPAELTKRREKISHERQVRAEFCALAALGLEWIAASRDPDDRKLIERRLSVEYKAGKAVERLTSLMVAKPTGDLDKILLQPPRKAWSELFERASELDKRRTELAHEAERLEHEAGRLRRKEFNAKALEVAACNTAKQAD